MTDTHQLRRDYIRTIEAHHTLNDTPLTLNQALELQATDTWLTAEHEHHEKVRRWLQAEHTWTNLNDRPRLYELASAGWAAMRAKTVNLDGVDNFTDLPLPLQLRYLVFAETVLTGVDTDLIALMDLNHHLNHAANRS